MKKPANGNCFTICRFIYDRIFISYPYRDHASFTLPTVSLTAPLSLSHFPSSFNALLLLIALFFFYFYFYLIKFSFCFFFVPLFSFMIKPSLTVLEKLISYLRLPFFFEVILIKYFKWDIRVLLNRKS